MGLDCRRAAVYYSRRMGQTKNNHRSLQRLLLLLILLLLFLQSSKTNQTNVFIFEMIKNKPNHVLVFPHAETRPPPLRQPSTAPCRSKSARLDLGCRPSWPSVPGDDRLPAGCSTRPQNLVGRTKELNLQNKAKLKTESRKFKTQRKHRTHHRILPPALCRNNHSRIWPNPRVQCPVSSSHSPESSVQCTLS